MRPIQRGKTFSKAVLESHFHKWLTLAFTLESGHTLVFGHRSAHSGPHGQTGGHSDGGRYHYSWRELCVPKSLRAEVGKAYFVFFAWGGGIVERSREPSERRRALCVSPFRGAAAPQGRAAPLLLLALHW